MHQAGGGRGALVAGGVRGSRRWRIFAMLSPRSWIAAWASGTARMTPLVVDPGAARDRRIAARRGGRAGHPPCSRSWTSARPTAPSRHPRPPRRSLPATCAPATTTNSTLSHTAAPQAGRRRGGARRDDAGRYGRDARPGHGGRLRHDGPAIEGRGGAVDRPGPPWRGLPVPAEPTRPSSSPGRAGIADDGDLTAPGAFGNLPVWRGVHRAPAGEGRILAASLAPLGLSDEPAVLTLKGGRLVSAEVASGPTTSGG